MKKINMLFLIIMLIASMFSISFATEAENDTMYLYTDESGELIYSDELEYEDSELVEDIYDYDDLYSEDDYSESTQEEIKADFEYQKESLFTKTEHSDDENTKMVITEILSDIKTEYTTDYYYYYAINYQLVKVKAEDGVETSAAVILSYDLTENKNISPLKVGDTIYGYIEYASLGSEEYAMLNHGLTDETIAYVSISEQDRALGIVLLAIFTILLLILYSGKHGAKLLIPIFVAIDLLFIVFAPEIEIGKNILILSILIALELIVLITVLKNGISRKTCIAIISSIIVVILVTALATYFANANRLSGKNIMYYDIQANVYYMDILFKSEINTSMLFISAIILITSVVTATIASKLTELSEKYAGSNNMVNNIIEEAKSIIAEYPVIIAIIFLVMILPKYMMIIYNGATFLEIINSETLVTEIAMLLFTLISVAIISPIHALISNLLMGDVEVKQIESKKE